MTTKHFSDANGNYIGGFGHGASPPNGAIETPQPPTVDHTWDGAAWVTNPSKALAKQDQLNRRQAALAKVTIALGITEEEFTDAVRYVLGN